MKLERNHLIIGLVIIAITGGLYMMFGEDTTDTLTVKIDGIEVRDPTFALAVYGAVNNVDYVNTEDAFVVTPGQRVEIIISAYNPASSPRGRYYKSSIYTESSTLFTSTPVFLEPDGIYDWFYTFTCPQAGRVSIYVESAVMDPFSETVYRFDDLDAFDILVVPASTPTATPTAYPTPTQTSTPTTTPHPYTTYTATPTATITPTPTSTPPVNGDTGDITPVLLWGGGIIGVLLLLLLALRVKR